MADDIVDIVAAVIEHAQNIPTNSMALLLPFVQSAALGVLGYPSLMLGYIYSAYVFWQINLNRLEKEITSRFHDKEITTRFMIAATATVVVAVVFMVLVFKYFENKPAISNVEQTPRTLEPAQRAAEQGQTGNIYANRHERERAKKRRQLEKRRLASN